MDWGQIERNWNQARQAVKQKWSKLTDNDLDAIGGRRNRLEDRIVKRYGFAADHVRTEIEDWLRWQRPKIRYSKTRRERTDIGPVE